MSVQGTLEVGTTGEGEVVINHPDLKPDAHGVGHIVFSPEQARDLAYILIKKAAQAAKELKSEMTAGEQARKLCVPLYAEIHRDIGGIITMGDIASIIGQRMHDVCIRMHEWTLAEAKAGSPHHEQTDGG